MMGRINRETENLKFVFGILEDGASVPIGCNKADSHLVFYARMTLEYNVQWFKDGHRNPKPECHAFVGVMSRESALITLTCATLDDLLICTCDAQNA